MNRRHWIAGAGTIAAAAFASPLCARGLVPLDVAYAGSMGSMMQGPIAVEAAQRLHVDIRGRAQGSDALAHLIAGGSIAPDVFIPVTPSPMQSVLRAGKATRAIPIARTEMVIAYSTKSKYARQFADAASGKHGATPWFRILTQPGIRFGRTDPAVDPQGRNILFTLQLAEGYYKQPGLTEQIAGTAINPAQIFSEATVEERLQSGELDAASAYKIQPGPFGLPYITLPEEINLGNASMQSRYDRAALQIEGKTYRPEPLVYYASALSEAAHPQLASAFIAWLASLAGQRIFRSYAYDPPIGAVALHA